jgi:branched-chain amino acid transport system substrate-binding protein
MRRSLPALLALLLGLPGCSGAKGDVVIGVVGPLSGPLAFVGEAQKRGAEIAADEINDEGGIGGRKVRLAVRDDSDPSRIVGTLRDLVLRERVVAMVGPEITTPLLGRNTPTARAGVPVLLPYAPLGSVSPPAAPNVFRLAPSDRDQAQVLARWLVGDRRIARVAVAYAADTEGRAGADLVRKAVAAAGGRTVAAREFPPTDVDQTDTVAALEPSRAGALVIWGTPADAARVVLAARRIGWHPQVAGPLGLFVADYRSLAGAASDDTAIVLPFRRDWFTPEVGLWFLRYFNRFGIVTLPRQRTLIPDLPILAMSSYDAVRLVAEAVKRAGTDPGKMVRALESLDGYDGIATDYAFSARDHEAYDAADLWMARFYNFAVLYDIDRRADRAEQIAFYKIQVSALYVPSSFFRTKPGERLQQRILEDVLTNPERVDFFKPYKPPRPPPGPIG